MKHALILSAAAFALVACGGTDAVVDDAGDTVADAPIASDGAVPPAVENLAEAQTDLDVQADLDIQDGAVVLQVDRLVSESSACLVMISVINGLDEPANAGLFAFDITGNDETMGANMFPQTAPPGGARTAQIVLPGADCANVERIEGGQLNCTLPDSGDSCVDAVVLRDGVVDFAVNE